MDAPRFRSLVDRLYKKTLDNELTWVENGEGFILFLTKGAIAISVNKTELGSEDFTLAILNKEGKVTDRFDDTEIEVRDYDGNLTYYPKMHEMYNMIRRQATGADAVLRSIMDELE